MTLLFRYHFAIRYYSLLLLAAVMSCYLSLQAEKSFVKAFQEASPWVQQELEDVCKGLEDMLGICNTAKNIYIQVRRIQEAVEAFMQNIIEQEEQKRRVQSGSWSQRYTFQVPGFLVV